MKRFIKIGYLILGFLFCALAWLVLFKLFPKTTLVISFFIGMILIIALTFTIPKE